MQGRGDDRNYVQSNGRHLNKRESDYPNFRRNNKHINSDTYRGYNSHSNSHRGSQMNHSNGKYNLNRNKRQGPLRDRPEDKFNQDANFLGYQQNPTDWPTLLEESLLKPLMKLLRVELENWGPARR